MNANTTKHYKLQDITATNIVAAPITPQTFMESVVQNNQTYHHNMAYPTDKKENKAGFDLEFPVMLTSSVNEVISEHGDPTYHVFADVFGNYPIAYGKVVSDVDKMLANVMPNTSPAQLKDLLFLEIEKRDKSVDALKQQYAEEVEATGMTFNEQYFRYLAIGALIMDELAKDTDGMAIYNAMASLKECYCASLDKQPAIKQKIYSGVGIPTKKLPKPSSSLVADIVQWQQVRSDDIFMNKKNDYTKSPQIHSKLFGWTLKGDVKPRSDLISVPGTAYVLSAKVYDYITNPYANKACATYEDIQHLLYRKGDSQSGKCAFKLLASSEIVAPSVFWSALTQKGVIQFKISKFKPSRKIELHGGGRTLGADERERDMAESRKAQEKFNLALYDEVVEEPGSPALKRSLGQSDQPNWEGGDIDALIDQDYASQQDYKRSKLY